MTTVLACPVCGGGLVMNTAAAVCASAHSFDRARSGYLNLLLSNKRQSAEPGDSPAMMASRRAFLQGGFYDGMADAANATVGEIVAGRSGSRAKGPTHVADLGCGEGYFTGRLSRALASAEPLGPVTYGVDISRPGTRMATAYSTDVHWIVASLHRSPFLPASLDVALSIFAPIDAADVRRVLRDDGALVTVTPGPDHLDALRIIIYTSVKPHPKTPTLMADDTYFEHTASTRVCYPIHIDSPVQIMNLLAMTPYYWHISRATKKAIEELSTLSLTVDVQINVFRPKARA
ncbi:MAG: methyltransferase domain-containing protein [Acidobacteria bacterium]|nr:methyltransferase domain-containing protein [Acidobacteriota bacterium]